MCCIYLDSSGNQVRMDEMTSNRLLITITIVAAALGGYILWPTLSARFAPSGKANLHTYTYGPLTVKTPLSSELTKEAIDFLKVTTKETLLPKELGLFLSEKAEGNRGDIYIGNWNQSGIYFSFLVGLTSNNKAINYQRIWVMPQPEDLTPQKAATLLSQTFRDSFLSERANLTCSVDKTAKPEPVTSCASMKSDPQGNLLGVTVRSPVTLPPPAGVTPPPGLVVPPVTVVSSCFVPKAGTPAYTASLCI